MKTSLGGSLKELGNSAGEITDYRERQHCKHSKIMEGLECWEDISILIPWTTGIP